MNKPNVAKFIRSVQVSITKHSPEILTGIGIAGMITTTVLAVSATPKALKLIEEKKQEDHVDILKPVEVVKVAWKPYIPAAITGVTSIVCLIGASSVHARRNAALATAYKLSETALSEYRDKVVETIGEKKEQIIREKIDKDRVDENPVSKNEVIVTSNGHTLCMDAISKRYFESDIEQIKKAVNKINGVLLRDDYVSLNDLYDELGLDHIELGDTLGWNVSRVGRDLIDLRFSSHIADNGRPCIVANYYPAPQYGYSSYL